MKAIKKLEIGYGPRCKSYEPGCATCEAWKLFDIAQRMPTFKEVYAEMRKADTVNELESKP